LKHVLPLLRALKETPEAISKLEAETNEVLYRDSGSQLDDAERYLKGIPMPASIAVLVGGIKSAIEGKGHPIRLSALFEALHGSIIAELNASVYLMIPASERELYEQKTAPFGDDVATVFPDANRDIAAAGRCLVVDEWTAAVFHLMRVLEHGLRKLATRFNVTFATDSWHKVIKGIEDGITTLRNKPGLTDADRDDITRCSEMAAEFRHFKDAWRNHVSHSRATYDEREATLIYEHVKSFMQHMAH
jgi:hypothetical protein